MSIMWQYLDKVKATEKAVRDYGAMKDIIEHTDERIRLIHEKMVGLGSSSLSDMPKGPHNPQAGEERLLKGIDEIDVQKERYRQAVEYMAWFKPAWKSLTDDERICLEAFYWGDDGSQAGAVYSLCNYFGIERSSVYNKKNRALSKLSLLLYGK